MFSPHFDGWDWTELADAWGIYIPESYAGKDMYEFCEKMRLNPELRDKTDSYIVCEDDGTETAHSWEELFGRIDYSVNEYENFDGYDPILWYIQIALKNSWDKDYNKPSRVIRKMANDVRCFAAALARDTHTYYGPFWEGLSKVEHDEVILRLISERHPLIGSMWD